MRNSRVVLRGAVLTIVAVSMVLGVGLPGPLVSGGAQAVVP